MIERLCHHVVMACSMVSVLVLASLQASVTCSVTGNLVIPDMNRINGKEGAEVFSERKGNLFNILKNKV